MSVRSAEADPQALLAKAEASEAAAAEAERGALVLGDLSIRRGDIEQHRADARAWRFGARAAQRRLDRQAAEKRTAALAALHSAITERAKRVTTGQLDEALATVRSAAETFMTLVADHDSAVHELRQRAHALDVHGTTPGGPDPANGFVATSGRGVQAGGSSLRMVGAEDALELAVQAAAGHDVRIDAASMVAPVVRRPGFVMVGAGGAVVTADVLTGSMHDSMSKGTLVRLTEAETDDWMSGRLAVDPGDLERRRAAQVSLARAQQATIAAETAAEQIRAQEAMGVSA